MKSFLFLLLPFFTLTISRAQDEERPNTLKINLVSLAFKSISVQFEHTLTNHLAFDIQLGIMIPHPFPSALFKIDTIGKNGSYTQALNAKFNSGFQFTPEIRYYFRGKGARGFYTGAYLRYSSYSISADGVHRENSSSPEKYYTYNGNATCTNLGIIIGSQFSLGSRIVLDWWILGLQAGVNRVSMKSEGDFSTVDKNDYINTADANLKQIPTFKNFSATMTNTEATLKFDFLLGLRSGLCLGFRF